MDPPDEYNGNTKWASALVVSSRTPQSQLEAPTQERALRSHDDMSVDDYVGGNSIETSNEALLALTALNVSLEQSNVLDVEEACRKLADLAQNKRDAELIKNLGGIECIINALYAHMNEAGVQKHACRAIVQFAKHWPHVCELWLKAHQKKT